MIIWDMFNILVTLFVMFWIPFKVSFDINRFLDLFQVGYRPVDVETLIQFLLIIDTIVKCNLAYIDRGIIIK